ncbi:hypothetical protein PanWU01x14_300580 [Parasponia andersonii]|uniref:Uncharacterized protein n=1 Tax=Parasponia andersonii TaxID=3476 RepID=A0A2P5AU10_PARAD|nr:hypothetical protein PanWU01x14_300580 [Parasponia andersonii]
MASQLCQVHWTEDVLATLGIHITLKFIDEALNCYWELSAKGLTDHVKAYVPFDKDAPGWTQGALVGFFGKYSGTKDIHFAPANAKIGKTGWFALACLNFLLQGKHDIDVFLFKARKVIEAVILALNYGAATKIKHIVVLTRGKSIDDMPADYIEQVLAACSLIVTNDMVAMESHSIDALALYYSRHGMKLTIHGREHGINNYTEILADAVLMEKLKTWGTCQLFTCGPRQH